MSNVGAMGRLSGETYPWGGAFVLPSVIYVIIVDCTARVHPAELNWSCAGRPCFHHGTIYNNIGVGRFSDPRTMIQCPKVRDNN